MEISLSKNDIVYLFFKRCFDLAFSLIAIIIFFPAFVVISILIYFESGGPVFYRGERVGYLGVKFKIFKFRTMSRDAENGPATTSLGDDRITRTGKHLRKFKLDELPQLFNVVNGTMSLVGPRPEVPAFVARYNQEQLQILTAIPGITDLASIHFRNMTQIIDDEDPEGSYIKNVWEKKNALRLEYVKTRCFKLDMLIIFRTLVALVAR